MKGKKVNKLIKTVVITLLALTIAFSGLYTYAWLSTSGRVTTADGEKKFARLGMKLDLLFDILDSDSSAGKTILTKNDGTSVTYDQNAEWGSAANPYIISDIRHLQNLSILQEIGYFDDRYISKNYSGGTYQNTSVMPYFLVCKPDGTPTAIDGDGVEFSPIGSDEYPFIGYVGGAFVNGDASVNNMTSDTSTLYNIHTVTTTDVTDVGLFGTIGYLGEEVLPSESNPTPSFTGYTSTVRDLLLYDVTVSVRNPSWQEVVAGHHFSYSKAGEFADELPHENHHIGILAGHVEYATVENISVYYSDNNICAIDLLHTNQSVSGSVTPNYSSSTGIMGMLYNMNPVITGSTIGVGTGTNDSDLSINAGGAGTGGGLVSGTGRGYVTAANIYDKYQYNGGIYSYTEGDYEKDAFVVYYTAETSRVRTGRNTYVNTHYKLEDGTPLVFATEGGKTVMQYWYTSQNFWGQTNYNHTNYDKFLVKESDDKFYYLGDKSREITDPKKTGVYIRLAADENGNNLCQQYVRDRLGNFGTQRTEMYYFKDGVFTFALSDAEDKIEATWKGDEADEFTIGPTNDAGWKANNISGNNTVVAFLKEIEDKDTFENAIANGRQIFIGYATDSGISLMSLYEASDRSSQISSNDVYTNNAFSKSYVKNVESIHETLMGAYAEDNNDILPYYIDKEGEHINYDVVNNTSDYILLDLGTSEEDKNNIEIISRQYPITVSKNEDKYVFQCASNNNKLSLLRIRRSSLIINDDFYSIYTGGSVPATDSYFGVRRYYGWETRASVDFIGDNVSISYNYSGVLNNVQANKVKYISFNGSNKFVGRDNVAYLKLYTVEGTSNLNFGRITFDPVNNNEPNAYSFNADEYLLWPNSTMTGASIGNGATMTADPSYSIKQLGVDLTSEKGWKNSLGQPLSRTDLYKKFTMGKGIGGQDTVISLGGSLSFGDSGILTAPIGSTGEKADIPTGCVAFRVNSAATETKPHKIRVIVAVPVSEYYYQEKNVTDTMDYINDYYFALWQVPAAGSNLYTNFNFQSAKEVFELPRSFKYSPEVGPGGNIKDGVSKYINIKYSGNDYRCYLNGDRVLVAYEFAVTDIGVYILGSNHPTQIVYFSADATVSAGRDGTSGSLLGSIDFVYDNSAVKPSGSTTKVVTVTQGPTDDMDKTVEDYNYYYSTLSLMYTDNTGGKTEAPYPDVNDFKAYIRRTATGGDDGTTTLTANITGTDEPYVLLRRYSEAGDTIVRNGTKQ